MDRPLGMSNMLLVPSWDSYINLLKSSHQYLGLNLITKWHDGRPIWVSIICIHFRRPPTVSLPTFCPVFARFLSVLVWTVDGRHAHKTLYTKYWWEIGSIARRSDVSKYMLSVIGKGGVTLQISWTSKLWSGTLTLLFQYNAPNFGLIEVWELFIICIRHIFRKLLFSNLFTSVFSTKTNALKIGAYKY